MDSEGPLTNAAFEHHRQMAELLARMIDQKKIVFKQLMAAVESLKYEIDQLDAERQTITATSAAKSLNDCLY